MSESYEELRNRLAERVRFLPDKPEENVDNTLHALWWCAVGEPKSAELASGATLPALTAQQAERLRELLALRVAGTPLAHITHRQRFMSMEMLTGPEALVPRKETELLAGAVIELASSCRH